MVDLLDPTKSGQKGMVLYGMPGSGKTQLALQYVERHHKLFTSIFWITASSPETASSSFSEAAALISSAWPIKDLPSPYQEHDDRQRVVSRLRSTLYQNWLLVIDSADDIHGRNFTNYVPICQHGSIIVTSTRKEAADIFRMENQEIGSLDPYNGQQLLLARLHSMRTATSSMLPLPPSTEGMN